MGNTILTVVLCCVGLYFFYSLAKFIFKGPHYKKPVDKENEDLDMKTKVLRNVLHDLKFTNTKEFYADYCNAVDELDCRAYVYGSGILLYNDGRRNNI